MKKKGTTESYSALIGIIIAFLMLTAIGCALYNMYKPKGANYFNKLADQLRDLERRGDGEGELTLFLEKDHFIVGFNKDQKAFVYSKDCPSNFEEGLIGWGCYGVHFLKPKEEISTLLLPSWWTAKTVDKRSIEILKPQKCAADKSCLCLCKMDKLQWMPWGISEGTCTEQTAVCTSFDILEFTGGEGCCEGVFIPGTQGMTEEERGLRVVYYKKVGNKISLSDIFFKSELQKAIDGERQKIVQLQEYLKTKKNVFFIPVNWDKDIREFDRAVTAHYDYTEKKVKALEKKMTATILNKLSDGFNIVNLKDYKDCTGLDLSAEMGKLREQLKNCLTKADPSITEEMLIKSKTVGITDDQSACGVTDTINTVITKSNNPKTTAHEWGHLMLFCDEYEYSEWKWQNEELKKENKECMNPYPVCCKDHPRWVGKTEEYKAYLEKEKIGPNCYPHYQDVGGKAKERFKTKEEYEEYINQYTLCQGHICKSEDPKYKYCRGIMSPAIPCINEYLIYDNSLDYSYLDFDRPEDFAAREVLAKNTQTTGYPVSEWDWAWPVETQRVTSCYGERGEATHAGIDIGPKSVGANGDPVYSVSSGTVRTVFKSCPDNPQKDCGGDYGNYVVVNQDDGLTVVYAHLISDIGVKEGQTVTKGDQIGRMGNSGHSENTHLHFGVYLTQQNPTASGSQGSINPTCVLAMGKATSTCPASTVCPYVT